jgi:uncharacterized protein involved in exopolysaccharide biosynthesis
MNEIAKDILQQSYWEHFKAAKDLALRLEPTHPKRIELDNAVKEILFKINQINQLT